MRIRFNLRVFLLSVCLIGMILGGVLRWHHYRPHGRWRDYDATTEDGSEYEMTAMWLHSGASKELLFIVAVPGRTPLSMSVGGGMSGTAKDHGIDLAPFGLFLDGRRVPTWGNRLVYVNTLEGTMRLVEDLTDDEVREIKSLDTPVEMTKLPVWREKVAPVIDREYQEAKMVWMKQVYGDMLPQILEQDELRIANDKR